MNITMGISTDPALLSVDLPGNGGTMSQSPSVSTFLPEEDASICPLLSTTPSPPLAFSHPLTPSAGDNCSQNSGIIGDTKAETSSSGSSSGIGMDVNDNDAATTLFNKNAYQHFGKTTENVFQENGLKKHGILNIPITKDTPSFVSWNWPLIRKCTFFIFMSSLLAMCAVVVAMIVTLPKTCNPKTAWYRGSVFYEIFPASFKDSNKNGIGDLQGITSRIDDLENLGISAIRLNSIFASKNYPDQYENITSLLEIDKAVGAIEHFEELALTLHARNISIVLDLPINLYLDKLEDMFEEEQDLNMKDDNDTITISVRPDNPVSEAMRYWLKYGADGFYIKGIENFRNRNDSNLLKYFKEWKNILGQDRVLIIDYNFFDNMELTLAQSLIKYVDLVEVYLDISIGAKHLKEQIEKVSKGLFAPSPDDGTWIQWSLGGVARKRLSKGKTFNATLAATIMQLMLPGTPNIFYGDEISLAEYHDLNKEHEETKHLHHLPPMQFSGARFTNGRSLPWLPESGDSSFDNAEDISKMIKLRDRSPSIYKNAIIKDEIAMPNINIRNSKDDILLIERTFPRRNSFVSISNFGKESVRIDLSKIYYSGQAMVGGTTTGKVYFADFEIGPMETIVVRLDK